MATPVDICRNYLQITIGLGANQAGLDKANAFIAQGLDSLQSLPDFAEEEGIKNLCATVRKPGGFIDDPNSVAANAAATAYNAGLQANQLPLPVPPITKMSDPGQNIPAVCKARITVASQAAQLYRSIGRPIDILSMERVRIDHIRDHIRIVSSNTQPESLPELSRSYSIMKLLDQFPGFLRESLGVRKVPLSYVIRTNNTNLGPLGAQVPWSYGMNSMTEELIAHLPLSGPGYQEDNALVFTYLMQSLANSQHLASITRFQASRDGRAAYLSLVMHNMGSSKWEKMVENAERCLNQRIWNGKNHRYPLKDHIARQREAFNDMKRAEAHIPYSAPNDTTRVRLLLNSITANDLKSAKDVIQADQQKKNDFELAADFLLLVTPNKQRTDPNHRISMVGTKRGWKAEDRYYKTPEWRQLTKDQQVEVRALRKKRKTNKQNSDTNSQEIAAIKADLESKNQLIAALTSQLTHNVPTKATSMTPVPIILQPPPGYQKKGGKKQE